MRGIKKILTFAFIAMVAAVPGSSAQRCGGSTNQIYIYVRNGTTLVNPRYHIISVSPSDVPYDDPRLSKFISDTFFADGIERRREFWHMESFILKPELVEKFLKTYKAENYDPAPEWRRLKKEDFSGRVDQGQIDLPTTEMFGYPYILKIHADNRQPVYVLGAHLGGCFPRERIILDETDARAYRDRWRD